MTASIIVCTRNRAERLRFTLESLRHVDVPVGWTVELLIVDNGSTDHTRQVADGASFSTVPSRYVLEPTPGLSHARNRAIAEARGDILLWIDDDILVPPQWLEKMCGPLLENEADAAAGGVIFPAEIDRRLTLLPDSHLKGWFASTHSIDRAAPERMVGANMAFHRRVLDRVPSFDTELGAGPRSSGFGEETLFSHQLIQAGYKIMGQFETTVEHHFDTSRVTKIALLASARKFGRTDAYLEYHWSHDRLRCPRLKLLCYRMWSLWLTLCDRLFGSKPYVISRSVLFAERQIAFYCEFIAQSRRDRRYDLRGLVRRGSL